MPSPSPLHKPFPARNWGNLPVSRPWRALAALILLQLAVPAAHAVPSFARQTGEECASCHVGGFGPQLTPRGRQFKLTGYTDSDGKPGKIPLAAMFLGSWTQTDKDQSGDAGPHARNNDNLSLDQASVFLAGRLAEHVGSFTQVTYTGVDRNLALDNMDIRYAQKLTMDGKNMIVGVSMNNNPTVSDAFNTVPAWRFPYVSSQLAPGGAASPLIVDGMGQQVLGASAYTLWDDMLYAELGVYRALSRPLLNATGAAADLGNTPGVTTYWRLAYLNDMYGQNFHAGLFGLDSRIEPRQFSGPSNKVSDVGVDASYQFLGTRKHIASVYGSYIREDRTLSADFTTGDAAQRNGSLDELMLNASYYYDQTWGVTLGRFDTKGSRDLGLYPAEPDSGSRLASPNTSGYTLQADWTPWGKEDSWQSPWANVRVGAQYVTYDHFNGSSSNYDGSGRNAGNNDTLFLFIWTAF